MELGFSVPSQVSDPSGDLWGRSMNRFVVEDAVVTTLFRVYSLPNNSK